MRWPAVATLVLLTALLSACRGGLSGECTARIVHDGAIYRSHNAATQLTLACVDLGAGKVIGCGGADARAVDTVTVRAFAGVDDSVAIVVLDPDWSGVYVRQGLKRAEWPPAIEAWAQG